MSKEHLQEDRFVREEYAGVTFPYPIHRMFGSTGAALSRGDVVVVDQLRFSVSCAVALRKMAAGGRMYIMEEPSKAISMREEERRQGKEAIWFGEDQGRKIPEADFGNSPAALDRIKDGSVDTILATSSNGVPLIKGLLLGNGAVSRVFSLSLFNFTATLEYLHTPKEVSSMDALTLLEAGTGYNQRVCHGDSIVARYFHMALLGQEFDPSHIREELEISGALDKFLDGPDGRFPRDDRQYLVQMDGVDFAVQAILEEGTGRVRLIRV